MIAVSTTELRGNLRKYLDLAKIQRVIVQCGRSETFEIVPSGRISDADRYMSIPENSASVRKGISEIEAGKGIKIDPKDIWKSL
jgi:PHD/YefM family antitoxin component YafN of YafNO toxin-antitoxin module